MICGWDKTVSILYITPEPLLTAMFLRAQLCSMLIQMVHGLRVTCSLLAQEVPSHMVSSIKAIAGTWRTKRHRNLAEEVSMLPVTVTLTLVTPLTFTTSKKMDGDSSVSHYNHISPLAETLRITHQVTTTFQKCITMVPMVLGMGTKSGRLVKVPQILLQKQRQRQLKCSISSCFVLYYSQIFGLHIEILREILLQNVCLFAKEILWLHQLVLPNWACWCHEATPLHLPIV